MVPAAPGFAMWSPPTLENNQQFAVLAQVFRAIGTPQLLASDFERGFFLMEDLGNLSFVGRL